MLFPCDLQVRNQKKMQAIRNSHDQGPGHVTTDFDGAGKSGNIMHEVHLLQNINHPNVIRCFGSFWKHGALYMVLELAGMSCAQTSQHHPSHKQTPIKIELSLDKEKSRGYGHNMM
jgi:hypothetical protein